MAECRGCGADILWAITAAGKTIPLDAKPTRGFVISESEHHGRMLRRAISAELHLSHFATCPDADTFRKER